MTDTPTPPRRQPPSPFVVERIAKVIANVSTPSFELADLPAGVRKTVEDLAVEIVEAIRGPEEDYPAPTSGECLTTEQVDRITHSYDPTGTLYADVYRLAGSHEALRDELRDLNKVQTQDLRQGGQYLGELIWLVAYLADNVPGDLLLPPRLASHVSGARNIYDQGRYTVAVPVRDTAPDRPPAGDEQPLQGGAAE